MSQVHVANNVMEAARLHSQGHYVRIIPFSSGLGRVGITLYQTPNQIERFDRPGKGEKRLERRDWGFVFFFSSFPRSSRVL